MLLKYKIEKNNIRIFGLNFVEQNKNNCEIFVDGIKKKLCSVLKYEEKFGDVRN